MRTYLSEECAATDQPNTPLDRLSDLARQADRIGDVLDGMIARFRGGGNKDAAETPRSSGYLADMDYLAERLDRIEKLTADLTTLA